MCICNIYSAQITDNIMILPLSLFSVSFIYNYLDNVHYVVLMVRVGYLYLVINYTEHI